MGATSVTGVGLGSSERRGSERMSIGVNHLIGPRWDESKERTFNRNNKLLYVLILTQTLSLTLLGYLIFWS